MSHLSWLLAAKRVQDSVLGKVGDGLEHPLVLNLEPFLLCAIAAGAITQPLRTLMRRTLINVVNRPCISCHKLGIAQTGMKGEAVRTPH